MKKYFKIEGTTLTRSSASRVYSHAAAFTKDGKPNHIASCSTSAAGAEKNARGAYPGSYYENSFKVFPLVEITAKEFNAIAKANKEASKLNVNINR